MRQSWQHTKVYCQMPEYMGKCKYSEQQLQKNRINSINRKEPFE